MSIMSLPTIKAIIITNVVALVAAVASLVWNTAVLTSEFERIQEDLSLTRAVQTSLVIDQERLGGRINTVEEARILLDGRIFRLEDILIKDR